MARTNFSFKKRQQEIERKKKQDEKRLRKLAKKTGDSDDTAAEIDDAPVSASVPTDAPEEARD